MEEVDSFISKPRFWFFISLVIIFVVLLILQFAKYMIMKEPIVVTPKISTERGTIYDRNKKILAVQTTVYNLYADKTLMKNSAEAAKALAPVLMQNESDLLEKIQDSKSNFLYLKKRMSESERDLVKNVIDENK